MPAKVHVACHMHTVPFFLGLLFSLVVCKLESGWQHLSV